MSVQRLAQRVSRHAHTVYVWEQEKRTPDHVSDVVALARELDVDLRWLLTGDVAHAPEGLGADVAREAVA